LDESRDEDNLHDLDIAELRQTAKLLAIPAQRDWKKEDFVKAISRKLEAVRLAESIGSMSTGSESKLQPGQARILIHRDPTPGAANSNIQLGLNGRFLNVPRGVEVTVPLEYVNVLSDAKQIVRTQVRAPNESMPEGVIEEREIQSYPFQVIEMRPHSKTSRFQSNLDQRAAYNARREAFVKDQGKWPTAGELQEWEKAKKEDARIERKIQLSK
jgi:hypothetical protein